MEKKKARKTEKKIEAKMTSSANNSVVGTRGRVFQGKVIRKIHNRIAIEFERTVYIPKFESYMKKKTRIHARLPDNLKDVQIGDLVKVQECRPLSKIIHFMVIELVKSGEQNGQN